MTTKDKSASVSRRQFLSSATAGVAAAALTKPAAAQEGSDQAGAQFAAITPPSAAAEAME
jgi:secreted PhoX family phosphatase